MDMATPEGFSLHKGWLDAAAQARLAAELAEVIRAAPFFAPLTPWGKPGIGWEDAITASTGLAFVCRIDLTTLLPKKHLEKADRDNLLRAALAYAQAEAAGRKRVSAAALNAIMAKHIATVADELRDLVSGEPLQAFGLPAFGIFAGFRDSQRPAVTSLRQALAILSRRRGKVFLRNSDPIIWEAFADPHMDLWTPVAPRRPS